MNHATGEIEEDSNRLSPSAEVHDSDDDAFSGEESDQAILMIQPDEVSGHKALRRIMDRIFVSKDHFRISCAMYEDMQPDEDGISRQLRSMLFPPSRQVKRRGKRRKRAADGDEDEEQISGNSQVQRQSKQKERCENKLMSLLFATVYDHATKRCRLAGNVPPLKLLKKDKKGQSRSVSNYTEVRAYLRHIMSVILAGHVSATNILQSLIPSVFGTLPSIFMLLAKTFTVFFIMDNTDKFVEGDGRDDVVRENQLRQIANHALDTCITYLDEYIIEWGRRNYTTDNPLKHYHTAGSTNENYIKVFNLLRTMISILPPAPGYPYAISDRERYLHVFSLPAGVDCSLPTGKCLLGSVCPRKAKETKNRAELCYEYVAALSSCASSADLSEFHVIDAALEDVEFPPAIWKTCTSNIDLHRLKEVSCRLQSDLGGHFDALRKDFIADTEYDVAQFWAAVTRSNAKYVSILRALDLKSTEDMRETVIELVFGGGIAATALFEREVHIYPIAEKLRGRKSRTRLERVKAIKPGSRDQPSVRPSQQERGENTTVGGEVLSRRNVDEISNEGGGSEDNENPEIPRNIPGKTATNGEVMKKSASRMLPEATTQPELEESEDRNEAEDTTAILGGDHRKNEAGKNPGFIKRRLIQERKDSPVRNPRVELEDGQIMKANSGSEESDDKLEPIRRRKRRSLHESALKATPKMTENTQAAIEEDISKQSRLDETKNGEGEEPNTHEKHTSIRRGSTSNGTKRVQTLVKRSTHRQSTKKRKRRGTITQTVQEANLPSTPGPRLRKTRRRE